MTKNKSKKEKIKNFLKPTKKKFVIAGLTATTLAGLALWDKTGYKIDIEILPILLQPKIHPRKILISIQYNPLLYPISHLIGHVKDQFMTDILRYRWGLRPEQNEYIIRQFLLNIPYYLGVGYTVGCSLEGTGDSFRYAKDKVFGKIGKFLKKYIKD